MRIELNAGEQGRLPLQPKLGKTRETGRTPAFSLKEAAGTGMPRRGGPGGHEGKGQDQEEGGEEEAEGIFAFDSAAARQAFLRQWKETTQRGAMLIVYDETWATVKNSIHDDACAMATNGAPRDQATTLASRCQATTSKPSFRATKRERERVAPARCTCKRNACVPEERGRAGD